MPWSPPSVCAESGNAISNLWQTPDNARRKLGNQILENAFTVKTSVWLRALGANWTNCDNISKYSNELFEALSGRGDASAMMTQKELKEFKALPEQLTVWRGCYDFNSSGWSWSLSRDVAAKFPSHVAYKHGGQTPLLIQGVVSKNDAFALKLGRQEAEIIVCPDDVTEVARVVLGPSF